MVAMNDDRRKLCQATGLILASTLIPACGSQGANGGTGGSPDGGAGGKVDTKLKPSDIPLNSAQPQISVQRAVFVCHDKDGFYAMDGNCTHRGCFVDFLTDKVSFHCQCHGATYDFNGGTPTPPAMGPMPHYDISLSTTGTIVVDYDKVVDATVRAKF
jgi:Rieske Fe-S protein